MRRISLAVALIGAVAAAGCGGGTKPAAKNGAQGTGILSYKLTINNQGPGSVKSTPAPTSATNTSVTPAAAITDAICPADSTCEFTFAGGTKVSLAATASGTNYFNGFFGGCSGTVCGLAGDADKYVVAYFSANAEAHPNFNDPALHIPAFQAFLTNPTTYALKCTTCHGDKLQGIGLAVACTMCHKDATVVAGWLSGSVPVPVLKAGQENCAACHATTGSAHQANYNAFADGINPATSKFAASIGTVVTSAGSPAGAFKSTVTFTLTNGTSTCPDPTKLKQKTMYFVSYDATANKFPTPSYKQPANLDPSGEIGGSNTEAINFSYGTMTKTSDSPCTYTMVKDGLPTDPLAAANAFVYGYFGDNVTGPTATLEGNLNPGGRHYALMDNMISVAKVVKGAIGYTSLATVSGCEKCHGAPYSKHGYRQADVAGLNTFVACKACHTDFRRGTDAAWYLGVNEPSLAPAGLPPASPGPEAIRLKYAYTANVMQDTHNSHAMEFAYPQSMANCTTCHAGKEALVTDNKYFDGVVCKSCHAVFNTGSTGEKRAPSFADKSDTTNKTTLGYALAYHDFVWTDVYDAAGTIIAPAGTIAVRDSASTATPKPIIGSQKCTVCHGDDVKDRVYNPTTHTYTETAGTGVIDQSGANFYFDGVTPTYVPLFKDIHNGFNKSIYKADGTKYSATAKMQIDSIAVDKTAKKVTVTFSAVSPPAGAVIKPTVVGSLYGYNTKDFIVSGHGSTGTPSTRILEWADGSTSNGPRLTVTGSGPWTAVADLSSATIFPIAWDGVLSATAKSTKMELGILPSVTLADGTSVAIAGVTATIDLTVAGNPVTPVANQYGKNIVDASKCNKCHDALGTTFHSPSYGSAGVVACRLCHVVGNGGSHLEMQSRSIDSYVHALHSFQFMDSKTVDHTDPFSAFEYEEHVLSVYPNFSIQNCESCHNPGTYDVPAQNRSLPSISSAAYTWTSPRALNTFAPAVITGPADRSCGSCHRSQLINEDDATGLGNLNGHMAGFGYRITPGDAATLSTTIAGLKAANLLP